MDKNPYQFSVPDLHGRLVILDKSNTIIAVLGHNSDPKTRVNYNFPQDQWIEGIFSPPTDRTGTPTEISTSRTGMLQGESRNSFESNRKLLGSPRISKKPRVSLEQTAVPLHN